MGTACGSFGLQFSATDRRPCPLQPFSSASFSGTLPVMGGVVERVVESQEAMRAAITDDGVANADTPSSGVSVSAPAFRQ